MHFPLILSEALLSHRQTRLALAVFGIVASQPAIATEMDLKTILCSDVNALGDDGKTTLVAWEAFAKGEVSARTKSTTVNVDDLNAIAGNVIAACQARPQRRFIDEFRAMDRQLSRLKDKSL
ncbi:MAG TPA: HdeA/HdeB family chaperone [Rhizomicrobium sp.]|nr:HdeA/HdeB family chaperone [Rhizomicrobium sp.]